MVTVQKVKDALDEAAKGGAERLLLTLKTFVLDLYNEATKLEQTVARLTKQNAYLKLRLDGMSHEDALKKVAAMPVAAAAAAAAPVQPVTAGETAAAPTETAAAAAAQPAASGPRLGANGEPLSPEEEAIEAAMDDAIDAGVKEGIASKVV